MERSCSVVRSGLVALVTSATLAAGCGPEDPVTDDLVSTESSLTSGGYAGFDISAYPGIDRMKWLRSLNPNGTPKSNLQFTGFYLGDGALQAPHHQGNDWMNDYPALQKAGWGFLPTYFGKQQEAQYGKGGRLTYASDLSAMSSDSGLVDGKAAAALMARAGFPQGRVVYLDVEKTGTPSSSPLDPRMIAYYIGWNDAVVAANYSPGVYCSYHFADALRAADNRPLFWVAQVNDYAPHDPSITQFPAPSPASSGVPYATAWQLRQDTSQQISDGKIVTTVGVDYDAATSPDPSIVTVAPAVPASLSPTNGQTINGSSVTLSWKNSPTATMYLIFLAVLQPNGTWGISTTQIKAMKSPFTLNGIPNNTRAAWTIFACNWADCAPQSEWQYFTHGK